MLANAEKVLEKRSSLQRLKLHLLHPKGMFQVVGLIACYGIFVAHLQDRQPTGGEALPLTIGNQALLDQLLQWIGPQLQSPTISASALFLLFAALLVALTWHGQRNFPGKFLLIGLQMLIGLLYNNDLLLLLAAQLPIVLRRRHAMACLGIQTIGMILVWNYIVAQHLQILPDLITAKGIGNTMDVASADLVSRVWGSLLLFVAWQTFSFGLGYIATVERGHRDRLTASNAELQATQQLLAESSRSMERMRIARELHDALGHHLTALGLHLELALRQSQIHGPKGEEVPVHLSSLETARSISKNLMAEVRNAVSRERQEDSIDLQRSVRTLCTGLPNLKVDLQLDPQLKITDPAAAHTLFRCIQEALSNVCRHAQANYVNIKLGKIDGGVFAEVLDDGVGANPVSEGNGIRGMRERVEALAGTLEIKARVPQGFALRLWVPLGASVV